MSDVLDRLDIHSGTVFNYHQERRKSKNYLADLFRAERNDIAGKKDIGEKEKKNDKDLPIMGAVSR